MNNLTRAGFKVRIRNFLDSVVERYGYRIVPSWVLYDWQVGKQGSVVAISSSDEDPDNYLTENNSRLRELVTDYAAMDPAVIVPSVWKEGIVSANELRLFRGDNAYVWQTRNVADINYALTAYYLKAIDDLGLLDTLEEDGAFGAHSFSVGERLVSRDLLDSVAEIYFLERNLNLSGRSDFKILDIGAGYGRLAHRVVCSLSGVSHYFCTDAVPISTFICEFYTRFRQVQRRVSVVPLHRLVQDLAGHEINLAINIHSFPECTIPAIEWWVGSLASLGVKYLMIVPNRVCECGEQLKLVTNRDEDFLPIVQAKGYRLIVSEPKYRDPIVQKYGIYPVRYYLFELP